MSFIQRLQQFRTNQTKVYKISWIGLDGAGKTAVIQRLKTGIFQDTTQRTMGLNVDKLKSANLKFLFWDIRGQLTFRDSLWKDYLKGSIGIVFVIDSTNVNRFNEARQDFWQYIIGKNQTNRIPLFILANKQDLPSARSTGEVARALNLHKILNQPYAILPTSATTDFNLEKALSWLGQRIRATNSLPDISTPEISIRSTQ